ncbi:hypothetical protein [Nitratidesulfovibrio liaohensis]|uniref:DUF2846 domain-containing protein n=1 Tax=Nitratidesulfovibrio liaohensis TaxID=2604158 RepID=A0ABY9QZZ3_9BACT|nr:hypothetical protein [Nitratidesulfovibrio liaohensis]WMW64774.1 hypothetical protein KPS_002834 [Nitratidesulfovibrio liaohensis]
MHKTSTRIATLVALAAVLLLAGLFAGCASREGVVQGDTKAYFWFTGNAEGAVAHLNDLPPFTLGQSSGAKDWNTTPKTKDTVYEVAPGRYTVIVERDGVVVVNRTVLVGAGMTKEILVP